MVSMLASSRRVRRHARSARAQSRVSVSIPPARKPLRWVLEFCWRSVGRGRLTRVQAPLLRSAIENHAVDRAIAHYENLGATDVVKLGKPYDVSLLLGGQVRHVEVNGSSLLIETVELTINEVHHAGHKQRTDLVVVDGIEWTRSDAGIATSGGRLRIWRDWVPEDPDLAPRKFAYSLPSKHSG